MIDIIGKSTDLRAARLSNFTNRRFTIDSIPAAGLEGFLQSLKCSDPEIQKEICLLSGKRAKQRGSEYDNDWKAQQTLWWKCTEYPRASRAYFELVSRAYDYVFEQDPSFCDDLLATGLEDLSHSIGKTDMRDTVLTEVEMIYQLNRLRIVATTMRSK